MGTPIRIWVDVTTGTFGGEEDLTWVDVSDWNEDDWQAFDNKTDAERARYAKEY